MKIGRLDIDITESRVTLAGRIDDATNLGELATQLPAGNITIDTAGVTFVNSIGMREWIRLIRQLRQRGTVILERVSDVLITQMNMIPELADSVQVASFHAQFVCSKCGAEAAPLIDAIANAAALREMKVPVVSCVECGSAMELADFPERYLTIFAPRATRGATPRR